MNEWIAVAVLVFYLYLAVRQQHIQRLGAFRIGAFAVFAMLMARLLALVPTSGADGLLGLGAWLAVAEAAAIAIAFLAALTACSPHRREPAD